MNFYIYFVIFLRGLYEIYDVTLNTIISLTNVITRRYRGAL